MAVLPLYEYLNHFSRRPIVESGSTFCTDDSGLHLTFSRAIFQLNSTVTSFSFTRQALLITVSAKAGASQV